MDSLVLGPSAALNRDLTATPDLNNTTETVPQLRVPQQSPTSQPPCLVSRCGQLQEQGFSVEVAERISAPQRSSTRTIYKAKWALFEKWCRENLVDFSTPSVQKISDFFMYLYLTLKTPFLLALASCKHRSEIHAWVANKVTNLGPSSDFIAKNQLAREGSQSMAPVTIPASTTLVDRQFKEDRTLCPVQALRI